MLTPELAVELTRLRIQQTNERATLVSRLGALPVAQPLFSFRRRVIPLPCAVELRPKLRSNQPHTAPAGVKSSASHAACTTSRLRSARRPEETSEHPEGSHTLPPAPLQRYGRTFAQSPMWSEAQRPPTG